MSQLWDWVNHLGLVPRLILAAGLCGLLGAAYLASPGTSSEPAWVFGGRDFPREELDTIRAVLDSAGIRRVVVEGRRVSVAADQLLQAQTALKKANLDPPSLDAILNDLNEPRWFIDDPESKRQRLDRARAEMAKHLIEQMPGIAEAEIHFVPIPVAGLSRVRSAKVLVDLRTETGEPPSYRAVREARELVLGVSDYVIQPEDVTLTSGGHHFLVAGNARRLRKVLTMARAEEWSEEIRARLSSIAWSRDGRGTPRDGDGLRVVVDLDLPPSSAWNRSRPRVNQPIDLEPEPSVAGETQALLDTAQAAVTVRLPGDQDRRFSRFPGEGAEPGGSAREDARSQDHARIEEAVRAVIPPTQLASVTIEEYVKAADAPEPARPMDPAAPSWLPLAGGLCLAGLVLVVIAWRSWRPASRPRASDRLHTHEDHRILSARVREFARQNPEAWARVLQRWMGEGRGGELDPRASVTPNRVPPPAADAPEPVIDVPPLRKAAILLVSLDEPLASRLLAQLDRASVEAVTLEIARVDRVSAEERQAVLEEFHDLGLRRLRFAFDDVAALSDTALRDVYHDEDAATWALALAGTPKPIRDKVLAALLPTQAAALNRALERLGPFRLDDAEAAQADLAERIRRLHDQGRLTLPRPMVAAGGSGGGLDPMQPGRPRYTAGRRRSLSELIDIDDLALLDGSDLRSVLAEVSVSEVLDALAGMPAGLRRQLLGKLPRESAQRLARAFEERGPVASDASRSAQRLLIEALCRLSRGGHVAYDAPEDMVA
jgi:flagellar motor switch protein FliG